MLGISDVWVVAAYMLCIASTVLCVVYGVLMWNKGAEPIKEEDVAWAQEEEAEE
jgi:hypothetical protein